MKRIQMTFAAGIAAALMLTALPRAHAAGMVPESTVVLIDEADGESSMNVKNSDAVPSLLYSTIQAVPEDKAPPVVLTPPVARVEPGKTQMVRFMLTNTEPLTVERYARVTFDSIPEKKDESKNKVTLSVRQNLPLVIHPKSLPADNAPWKRLKWSRSGGDIVVTNDSPYVVRVDQKIKLMPGDREATLGKPYLVPGERATVTVPKGEAGASASSAAPVSKIVITPFTAYGYASAPYEAAIDVTPAPTTAQ